MLKMSDAKFEEIKEYISDRKVVETNARIDPVGYANMLVDFCEVLIEEVLAQKEKT
jgi:hypothetical protein